MIKFNTYLLIDYENIHPSIFEIRSIHENVNIFVFARGNERFPLSFYNYVSKRGKFVEIKGTGRNLLDFHIILYIGKFITDSKYKNLLNSSEDFDSIKNIATTSEIRNLNIDTQDKIYILSKDTDYDGVLKFLYENENFYIKRVSTLEELPEDLYLNQSKLHLSLSLERDFQESDKIDESELSKIANKITNMAKRPKKIENVINLINEHFNNSLSYNSILYVLKDLTLKRKVFSFSENDRVVYHID